MKHILLTISLIFGATAASAEPSSGIKTLMDRPMSMLDWGMYRLQKELEASDSKTYVSYSWQNNEILVSSFSGLASKVSSMEEAKQNCDKRFAAWDIELLIFDGKEQYGFCSICDFFNHNGFSYKGFDEVIKDVKERIYYAAREGKYNCRRKLYGTSTSTSVSK
ncbi:hypothetical protein N9U01_04315 [Paracoccaceae bacterium]|nr:hypothetical protein [Paracoccaceae bacterium]